MESQGHSAKMGTKMQCSRYDCVLCAQACPESFRNKNGSGPSLYEPSGEADSVVQGCRLGGVGLKGSHSMEVGRQGQGVLGKEAYLGYGR